MDLYSILCHIAEEKEARIHIDLINKDIMVGKTFIIQNGEVKTASFNTKSAQYDFSTLIDGEHDLCALYHNYKYSCPTEKRWHEKKWFFALTAEQMTDEQLACGEDRYLAKIKLIAYVLLASLQGILKWKDDKRYYCLGHELVGSPTIDNDFVVMKMYIQ